MLLIKSVLIELSLEVMDHAFHYPIFWQALHFWFEHDFLRNSPKMSAMRQWSGDASAFIAKDSVERRILASLCSDYGMCLAQFCLVGCRSDDDVETQNKTDGLRKYASHLFWAHLENLHPFSDMKLLQGSRNRSFKAICVHYISTAISRWLKRNQL